MAVTDSPDAPSQAKSSSWPIVLLCRSLPLLGLRVLRRSPGRSGTAFATPLSHIELQVVACVAMAVAAQQPSRAEAARPAAIGQRSAPDTTAGAGDVCLGWAVWGQFEGGHPQGMLQPVQKVSVLADALDFQCGVGGQPAGHNSQGLCQAVHLPCWLMGTPANASPRLSCPVVRHTTCTSLS